MSIIKEKVEEHFEKILKELEIRYFTKMIFNPTAHPSAWTEVMSEIDWVYNPDMKIWKKTHQYKMWFIADNRTDIYFYEWLMGSKEGDLLQSQLEKQNPEEQ